MDATTHIPTILLAIGILCVFLGVFGGGFQIKEISIPKIDNISRALGAVFGLALIVWSQIGAIKTPDSPDSAAIASVRPAPETDPSGIVKPVHNDDLLKSKIDGLSPSWETLDISNKDILAEYVSIKEDDGFNSLPLIYKSEVNNKINTLNFSIDAVDRINKKLTSGLVTLAEKVRHLDKFFAEDASNARISQRVRQILEGEQNSYRAALDSSARIGSANDFLTCRSIVNKNCSKSTSLFTTPMVWVWANITSPKNTEVTLKWVNLDNGEQFHSRNYTIKKSTGYRISAGKTIHDEGKYEVRLYNNKDELVAKKQFEVR